MFIKGEQVKNLFLLTIMSALLVSCKSDYDGKLSVKEDFEVVVKTRKKKGEIIKTTETVPAGNYEGKIKVNKKSLEFKFEEEIADSKLKNIKIKVNKDAREKLKEDKFILTPEDTNQDFSLDIEKKYSRETGNYHSGTTSCTWYTYSQQCGTKCSTVCGDYYYDENGVKRRPCQEQCGYECWQVSIPHPGTQTYDSYTEYETWTINADILKADGGAVISSLSGVIHKTDTHTSYGACY